MDRRFERVWRRMEEEKRAGVPFPEVIGKARNEELVAALAAASPRDAVAANALATELLNRLHRGPFLGAFVVSLTTVLLVYALDYVYTGTFLFLDIGPRANLLTALTVGMAGVSLASYLMWRGRLRRLRFSLRPRRVL